MKESNIPQLDLAIRDALVSGDEQRAMELERGAPLFIFLRRDHGAREKSAKREKMSPEEKMKPVAAREATRLLTARPLGAIIATKN